MLIRRFAMAIGILFAVITSQLPEYSQQYRQRLGGAIDELRAALAEFDAEAGRLSLDRSAGIARLESDRDELAQARGRDIAATAEREARLERQQTAFTTAGPLSQYWVLASQFDSRIGGRAYGDFQPAVPVTTAGLLAALSGLVAGWGLTHAAALPLRRRHPATTGHVRI